MPRRILLADDSQVSAALARELREAGFEVDEAAPASAPSRLEPGHHALALVRDGDAAAVAALRAADPLLPVVALLSRDDGASAHAAADAVLVGAPGASALAAVCALAAKLRDRSARVRELEARLEQATAPGARDLEFLKRLLFVEVKRSRRYGHPIALAIVALDGWSALGPTLDPAMRTAALGELLGVITGSLRDIDLAAPFSDERFVVLMAHTKQDGALRVARRICARIRERKAAPEVTVSVGVAAHRGDGTVSFGGLVKRATDALAKAQAAGGDRVEVGEPPKKRARISIG